MFGLCALFVVLLVVVSALGGLVAEAGRVAIWDELAKPVTLSILRFTVLQAASSTLAPDYKDG